MVSVRFSEPMQRAFGAVIVNPGDITLRASDGSWSENDQVVSFGEIGPLETGKTYSMEVEETFRDKQNNTLEAPSTSRFQVPEMIPPRVDSTVPALGMEVGEITQIRINFSEPMDTSSGVATLSSPGEITRSFWENGSSLVLTLAPLQGGQSYTLTLTEFIGLDGLALDARDTEFSFTTTVADARVVSAKPAEGEQEVIAEETFRIEVDFSRPVQVVEQELTLEDSLGESIELGPVTFQQEGRRMRIPLVGNLLPERSYKLDLRAVESVDGAPFDTNRYLGDGILDFTTAAIVLEPPRVLASDPADGMRDVPTSITRIDLVFDQRMDPGETVATLSGDGRDIALDGTWGAEALRITFLLPEPLVPNTDYSLDISALVSDDGEPPAPSAASIDFRTRDASGERCDEALGVDAATVDADGRSSWLIEDGGVGGIDQDFPCDASGFGPDTVIRYEKTSPSFSNGGKLLVVKAVGERPLNLYISRGNCQSGDQQACLSGRSEWSSILDVSPGIYNIWVAPAIAGESFRETLITLEEVDAYPPGESCVAPFDTSSDSYQSPASADDPHTWTLPADAIASVDLGQDSQGLRCAGAGSAGVDAVIAFDKQDASSVLDVEVRAVGMDADDDRVHVAVLGDCADTTSAARCGVGREVSFDSIEAPAGTVYIGVSLDQVNARWPEVEVEVREVALAAGESCATAFSAVAGVNAITGTSTASRGAPGCFANGAAVEWYRYTLTEDTLQIISDMSDAGIAVVSPQTNRQLACTRDATAMSSTPIDLLAQVGDEVCVAVEQGANAASQFELLETSAPMGSSCASAIPLNEGGNPTMMATSGRRYNAPACLPAGEDVTWYSFTATDEIVRLTALGANVALQDRQTGAVLGCGEDRVGRRVAVGDEVCVAVAGAPSQVTLSNRAYDGVKGAPVQLAVTLPTQPDGQPRSFTGDRWMVADETHLYMLHYATPADVGILEVPLAGGAGVFYGPNEGISLTNLGYAATMVDGDLFSLDDSTGATRLYLLSRSGQSYSASVRDMGSSYGAGESRAVARSGSSLYSITHRAPIVVFEHPLSSSAPATQAAQLQSMTDVTGLVGDNSYLYIAGRSVNGEEGIFRLPRVLLGAPMPTPELIASVDLDLDFITPMALDATSNPGFLYYRATSPTQRVGAIASPASGSNVLDIGTIANVGDVGDHAMTYDLQGDRLILFASENGSPGEFYAIER